MSTVQIREDFLPSQAPSTTCARRIDFEKSDPPLPKYKDLFAAVIDNFLTEAECQELIKLAEASTSDGWERALINIGGGRQMLATDTRNCARIIWDSPELAKRLLDRLMPFLRDFEIDKFTNRLRVTGLAGRGKSYCLTELNERLRFLRYEGGEYFRPHWDGKYEAPNGDASYYTIHLYLNGMGDQDLQDLIKAEKKKESNPDPKGELLGGATSFCPIPSFKSSDEQLRVFPRTGSILIFQQKDLMHSGDPVFSGTKYTMRTDIMYREL
ncbi:uncharacterized protein N7482_002253 [Penicillium canariense]|uniref:Prolyl 4-hydroxylase alpha subunit domain-containing protein n=1 Tax=Penicillium canariense TaxID=189055 RepID=A0A9W9LTU8_9EURO|nr:uncharacterized protein N7482_002253 [Penicillium canariense]KAJ5176376.1 hypothetical protein N7482_002253 [Penicillium canariense]